MGIVPDAEIREGCPRSRRCCETWDPDSGTTLNDIPEAWAGGAHFRAAGVIVRDVGT